MTNQQHLKVLKQGVATWNQWRKKYPGKLNLGHANLSRAILMGADLSQADLSGATATSKQLTEANNVTPEQYAQIKPPGSSQHLGNTVCLHLKIES